NTSRPAAMPPRSHSISIATSAARPRIATITRELAVRLCTSPLHERHELIMADPAPPSKPHPGPLQGIRVLDFSAMLAGPHCARLMADLGAEIIKVEGLQGDPIRGGGPRARA